MDPQFCTKGICGSFIGTLKAIGLIMFIMLCAIPAGGMAGMLQKSASNAANNRDTMLISLGGFSVTIPNSWEKYNQSEAKGLYDTFVEQSQAIYENYSGARDATRSVDMAAFHIDGSASFIMVIMSVPPQTDLIGMLKQQAPDKAAWGVREGYIKKYLGLVPVKNGPLSGFYIKTVGNNDGVELSGGLEHSAKKNSIIQLTLLPPKTWKMEKAVQVLTELMDTVHLVK